MALCFLLEVFCVESYLALCSYVVVFSAMTSTVIISLGEELAGLYASSAFVVYGA